MDNNDRLAAVKAAMDVVRQANLASHEAIRKLYVAAGITPGDVFNHEEIMRAYHSLDRAYLCARQVQKNVQFVVSLEGAP